MNYVLDFTEQAQNDLRLHKKSGNKPIIKKIVKLLKETAETPFEGTGKPELLKHELSGIWSRRINLEHRIVYKVEDDRVIVHSLYGHY